VRRSVRIGKLGDGVLDQRRALADAEQFVAHDAVVASACCSASPARAGRGGRHRCGRRSPTVAARFAFRVRSRWLRACHCFHP
jgi:hypothetical protein